MGNNAAIPTDVTTDLDGNPRVLDGAVDLSPYEAPVTHSIYLPLVLRATDG